MERSHLQPQVVFRRAAEIEGKSQAALRARLLSTAVLVLYTVQTESRREAERKDGKQRDEKRSRGLRRGGVGWRRRRRKSGMKEEEDIFIYRNKRKTAAFPPPVEQTPHV